MKINISIDDICPHPKSSEIILEKCFGLIDIFKDIKFTLFIPMAYTRLNEKSYHLSEYPEFCQVLKNLDSNYFELAWHGFLHGIPGKSNNDEFRYLDFRGAMEVFKSMFEVAENNGLKSIFKPIFRPPAFWMSGGSLMASKKMGIKILALSPYMAYDHGNVALDQFAKIIYFDSLPPIYPLIKKDKVEIVYHASQWNKNILDKKQIEDLTSYISSSNKNEFVFMEDF